MPSKDELERLYDAHATALHGFALSLTHSDADARDLLQDLFVKLARQPTLLHGVRDERAFLLRLLHNSAVDRFRRQHTRVTAAEHLARQPATLFAPTPDPDEHTFRTRVTEALAALPPDQRAVVHLKLWEDLTFDAIADLLGISLNTAASRYRYAMDKLRPRLRPLYEETR